ncbi:endolytic transglycosylase MltG [Thermodesulfobacterium sp. TA1]|uniref:endolytic transglycosylase MltG n=1 Tax=Thermodesulfobacterium sp. TA1 TaxID=2234087 RepID=UPI001232584F|nr:endolytic transglycosylase MltG [Thermodesulfobacterium sp. TA1]QER41415.1 endolytic transglycosylase MltG [Thermodesulfobacterium sp. TA1]
MKFSRHKKKKWVLISGLIVLLVLFVWFLGYYFEGLEPIIKGPTKEFKVVEIKKGEGVWTIAQKLKKQGVIKSSLVFCFEAFRKGYYHKIKPGEYGFYLNQPLSEILEMLVEGKVLAKKVTIPEGYTLWQIADLLEKNEICSKEEFLKLAENPQTAKQYGLPGPTLEGYLFPDTYYFYRNSHPGQVIKTMVENFWKNWRKYEEIANKQKKSLKEVIILASIVEKEAYLNSEKPIIAAVYLNRIKKKMPLQADPTINYALKSFRRLTYKDYYTVKSPYNTYLNPGLPPTPIGNPGEESIKAVIFPAKVPYLYFVASGNGSHIFSVTYKDHLEAINKIRSTPKSSPSNQTSENLVYQTSEEKLSTEKNFDTKL